MLTSVCFDSDASLRDQLRTVVWRIFGEGESPLKGRSSYELIIPMVEGHIAAPDRSRVIVKIQGWFESHGNQHWLRAEITDRVAELVLDGIDRMDPSEAAAWAIGSIDAMSAAKQIRSNWSDTAIDSFVEAALAALATACNRGKVLDPSRALGRELDSASANIPVDAIVQDGRIATFQNLLNHGLHLVVGGLYPSVENLIDLVVTLRPERFGSVAERLDHPVLQTRAARWASTAARLTNHRTTLDWIVADSCAAQIALAIVLSLETVNALDNDLRLGGDDDMAGHTWATELSPQCDDLDAAAASLLAGLVERLSQLEPLGGAQWIGELLTAAPRSLHAQSDGKPLRVQQLETACTTALAHLVNRSWPNDLAESLTTGLRATSQETWTRHLADLAWFLRKSAPARAAEIARTALCAHEAHVAHVLKHDRPIQNLRYWGHREWICGLGACLAIADQGLDLRRWVVERCQSLPLSVWDADAEEGRLRFITAEKVAQHWFLVAFHAIQCLGKLGARVDPAAVLSLTEIFWDHCRFVQPHVVDRPESSETAEFVARCAIEFGDAGDRWLLEQARRPAVEASILWAVIDQRMQKHKRDWDSGVGLHTDEILVAEFASIASDRFGDGRKYGLDDLEYWGRLWLLLESVKQAELAANAILAFPQNVLARGRLILALKLLTLVAGKRKLEHPNLDRLRSLYTELWSVYTPKKERLDREQVEALAKDLFAATRN